MERLQEFIDYGLAMVVARRLGRSFESVFIPLNGTLTPAGSRPLRSLDDNTAVPFFSDWTSIKIPGHTGHMIGTYHAHSQVFYAADLLVASNAGHRFLPPMPIDIDFAYDHTIHRLRHLPVRYALLAHGGAVNVDDFGGWNAILDEVMRHRSKPPHPKMVFAAKLFSGFSSEPRMFTRDMLPRGPLPPSSPAGSLPFIAHMK